MNMDNNVYIITVKKSGDKFIREFVGSRQNCEEWLRKNGYGCYICLGNFDTTRLRLLVNAGVVVRKSINMFDEREVQCEGGM